MNAKTGTAKILSPFLSSERLYSDTMMTLNTDEKAAEALNKVTPMRIFYNPKACDFDDTNLANSVRNKGRGHLHQLICYSTRLTTRLTTHL